MSVPIDLAIVIVTHDSEHDLGDCLSSVFARSGPIRMRVVVSDAGSTDRTAEVASRYPILFLAGPNEGFAKGNNRALAHEATRSARYVLFLNPDTQLSTGTLPDLIGLCDARPKSGLFTVREIDQYGRLVPNLWRFASLALYWAEALPIGPLRRLQGLRVDVEEYEREGPFDWATGAFLLVRREVLDAVGGFDERFFLFQEEADFCRRAALAGFRGSYLPVMSFVHKVADRPFDPREERLRARAKVIYATKWLSRGQLPLGMLAFFIRWARRSLHPSAKVRRQARARLLGSLRPGSRP